MTTPPSSATLDRLRAVPGGFGQPSFASLLAAILADAEAQAAAGAPPPTLLVIGEPLAGKSTFLSGLIARLLDEDASSPRGRPYLVRWGDTIRGGKRRGVVAQERQFGDLTPEEFAGTSRLLAEAAQAAGTAAAVAGGPALVVVEAPGMTMLTGPDGQRRGLDRGYTLARELAADPHGYLLALCADHQVREANLGGRHAQITAGGPEIREATQLAANRIRQQVTDVLFELGSAGTIPLPEPRPESPLTRESLDRHPDYRNESVLRAYLPYLLRDDLAFPPERAFIGLNAFVEGAAPPDAALMDRYDWTHEHFGV
ncbi:MAG: hypothetical protein IT306_30590 [Chloroflexi bacterium]|nr:hypothetical protein [Chloroflexota bacterium]